MPWAQSGLDVFDRSILGITDDLARSQMGAKAHMPKEIEHRQIVCHLGGGDQRRQNDATFASIDH